MTGAAGQTGNKFAAKWSPAERDNIKALCDSGMSCREVAIALGTTKGVISGVMARMGKPRIAGPERIEQDRLRKERRRKEKMAAGFVYDGNRWLTKEAADKRRNGAMVQRIARKKEAKAPKPIQAPPAAPTSATNVTMVDLPYSGACKFPVVMATGAAQLFCGAAAEGVWCPYHRLIVWRPNEERRTKRQPVSTYRQFGAVS